MRSQKVNINRLSNVLDIQMPEVHSSDEEMKRTMKEASKVFDTLDFLDDLKHQNRGSDSTSEDYTPI